MRLISWNIDGLEQGSPDLDGPSPTRLSDDPLLDEDRVLERHLALIPVISQFDVIFMQEVIPESWQTIKANMPNYLHFEGVSIG